MFRECCNLSIISSQCSQVSEYGLTPRDVDQAHHAQFSPMRKRGKPGRISRMLGVDGENNPSLFNLVTSQESLLCESQPGYSQDVVNRLGQLSCRQEESVDGFLEDTTSIDAYSLPPTQQKSIARTRPTSSDFEGEKKIVIAPAVKNPFLPTPPSKSRKAKKPTNIWVQPYKERPRYLSDFEEEGVLGEGSFSVVYAARRRHDGVLYAVKKLKIRISSESEGISMTKEVCALAALKGCPNLVQYFGSWVEDGHLWLQTELCFKATLDVFVSPTKPPVAGRFEAPICTAFAGCSSSDGVNISLGSSEEGLLSCCSAAASPAAIGEGHSITSPSSPAGGLHVPSNAQTQAQREHLLVFSEDLFFRILAGVCNALAFMHARGEGLIFSAGIMQ